MQAVKMRRVWKFKRKVSTQNRTEKMRCFDLSSVLKENLRNAASCFLSFHDA